MGKPTVDELLSESSPLFAPSVATEAALDALVLETRSASVERRMPQRRRSLWLVPGVVAAVGALTAGAVVVDDYLRVDVPIAIEYTTDTGITVECTANIDGGTFFAPKPTDVIDYYKSHDFTGVGQRIYDYALVLAGDTEGTPDVLPNSAGGLPDGDFRYSDQAALSHSMSLFLVWDVLLDLGLDDVSGGVGAALGSDCTGRLH